jgi:hypothetical protein
MQVITPLVMLLLAWRAASPGLALVGAMFFLFDAVYAAWYNRAHIAHAMPRAWSEFCAAVPHWRPRWRPHIPGEAELVIAPDGPGRRFFERIWPRFSRCLSGRIALRIAPRPGFTRLIYRRSELGLEETGTAALSRLLDHAPAPVAMLGWVLRFPLLDPLAQRVSSCIIKRWREREGL